jgi:hypothetical protein
MKRIISVLAVAALMAMIVVVMSVPSFAAPKESAQDDKNNDTFPGFSVGQDRDVSHFDRARDNTDANCDKHEDPETGEFVHGAPAQCYTPQPD